MVFSVSAVVLLGIILVIVIRNKQLRVGFAVLAMLFGFFLAKTSAAVPIQTFLTQITNSVNNITH